MKATERMLEKSIANQQIKTLEWQLSNLELSEQDRQEIINLLWFKERYKKVLTGKK